MLISPVAESNRTDAYHDSIGDAYGLGHSRTPLALSLTDARREVGCRYCPINQ